MYVIVYDDAIGDRLHGKTVAGSYNRVALGTSTADGTVRDNLLVQVEPLYKGLREVGASTYAKEVSDTSPVVVCAFDSALSPT